MTPLVSVCIPVYNGERHLGEAIASVLAQTLADFELIVMDNVSTDATAAIAEAFDDPRIRVERPAEHVDVIANWNRATALCTGRYVKLLCHDDTIAPGCLELQVAALEASPGAAMVACRRDITDEHGHVLLAGRGLAGLNGYVDGADAIVRSVRAGTNIFGEPASVLLRGDVLRAIGPWSGDFPYCVDVELYFRMLEAGGLLALPVTQAIFRTHAGSWSAAVQADQARQSRQLFEAWAARPGSRVRRRDVLLGAARAEQLKLGRRVVLSSWFRRLRTRGAA